MKEYSLSVEFRQFHCVIQFENGMPILSGFKSMNCNENEWIYPLHDQLLKMGG